MPSELETQKARKEALLQQAIASHNEGVREVKADRLRARRELEGMIREQKLAHKRRQREQERQANEGGWLAGAFQGAGTGLSLGMMSGNPLVAAATTAGGALFGGIYGATQGRQAVQEMAPYTSTVSQLAGGYSGMQAQKESQKKLLDFYQGRDYRPGSTAGGAYPGDTPMGLGRSDLQFESLDVPNQFDFGNAQVDYAFTPPAPPDPPPPPTTDQWGYRR